LWLPLGITWTCCDCIKRLWLQLTGGWPWSLAWTSLCIVNAALTLTTHTYTYTQHSGHWPVLTIGYCMDDHLWSPREHGVWVGGVSRQKVGLRVVYVVCYLRMCLIRLCVSFRGLIVAVFSESEDYNLYFVTYKTTTVLQIVAQTHLFI